MRKIRNTIVATMLFASIMLCSANVNAAARVNGTCGSAGVGGISTIGHQKQQVLRKVLLFMKKII